MERKRISSGTRWESKVGYSRAVQTNSQVHISGTTATDDDGDIVGKGDAYQQTKKALQNIENGLRETDASLEDVVRTRMFVTNIDEWEAIGEAHGEVFGEVRPTASMVEVNRLIDPALLVEVEAIAILPE